MMKVSERPQRNLASLAVLLLLLLSLVPVWGVSYLPMQDFPQHLLQAKLVAGVLSGHGVAGTAYQVHLKPTYSLLYVVTWLFQLVMPLEAAGRAAVSVYLVLVACVAWRTVRYQQRRGNEGWGAVFLFPLAFSQMYFMGFVNYLYAVPVMWLVLLQLLEGLEKRWRWQQWGMHAASLVVLLFVHPFAIGMMAVVVGAWVVVGWRTPGARRVLLTSLAMCVLVGAAWWGAGIVQGSRNMGGGGMRFESPLKNLLFITYAFAGLRGPGHPEWIELGLWVLAAGVITWSAIRHSRGFQWRNARFAIMAVAALWMTVVFGPAMLNDAWTYLNTRVTLGLNLALAVLASFVPMGRREGVACALIAAALLADSYGIQRMIGAETEEVRPVIAALPRDSVMLPLMFDRDSTEADGYYFSLHVGDHYYCQVAKGGVCPYLWYAPAEGNTPVSFRPGVTLPAPPPYLPTEFRWEKYGEPYRYFLVRGGSESLYRYMERGAVLRVVSGKWRLYERAAAETGR